ncbi:MarR family winged helix-turn-helix transcriptional regulator [Pseudonocardia alni]|uniref:MarR family winged helix-turn-helix transcriptional regulator n=1 Tax=Pseudonocardia alni TaxID=33907 RepID=UPI00332E5A01
MESADDVMTPFLLMRAFRGLIDSVHRHLAEEGYPGIRAHHGFALQAIADGCTSVELGARLNVTKQAATKTARGLEAMGLVRREQNESDRRERTLIVTPHGRRLLALSATAFRREVAGWRTLVGDPAVDATLRTLAAVGTGGRGDTDLSDWG